MENYAFKSVAFGGFDKQDVIHYIEQTAKEAAAVQERLQKENEDLQTEADSLRTQVRELQTRLETETALREQAQSELEQERTARQGLEAFKPEAERLAASSGTGWGTSSATPTNGPLSWRRPPPPGCAARWSCSGPSM
mgnify:CR=1 FL=1